MQWLLILILATSMEGIFGQGIVGESNNSVIFINGTGLKIVRLVISGRSYEDIQTKADRIMINVSPKKHHMELVFRGGATIDWPSFNFAGVHEVVFDLAGNRIVAHPK